MSVYPRADGVYVYDFWHQRHRFCGTTGCTNERDARRFEDEKREEAKIEVKRRRDARNAPLTIDLALDKFWIEVGQHYGGSYGKTVFTALQWMLNEFGSDLLVFSADPETPSLTSGRIAEAIARRRADKVLRKKTLQPITNAAVNRTLTELLRRILRRAVNVWERPVHKVVWADLMLPEPKERVRELRDHEEDKLWQNMRADYLPALAFFLASGCRLKELVTLRKDWFDWSARLLTIHGKGDRKRVIPISQEMAAIVSPLRDHPGELVFTYVSQRAKRHPQTRALIPKGQRFPISYNGLKTTWRRHGGAAAGVDDFRLHDTRHTKATRLLRSSGNLKLVQQLLGHEDIATTAKYAHVTVEDLRQAMERDTKSRRAMKSNQEETSAHRDRR